MNYYNENDPYAVEWLCNLIDEELIPDGIVDERSIEQVRPGDVARYTQCHFFAGIAGWPYALELAGWPVNRPVWTGSCPCQPFSVAGQGKGAADKRHLWPHFFRLIAACRPEVVMGEQVSGHAGYDWLDGVAADLEGEGYSCRAVDIPACGVGSPHIRSRLYWVAHSQEQPQRESQYEKRSKPWGWARADAGGGGSGHQRVAHECTPIERGGGAGRMEDADRTVGGQGQPSGDDADGQAAGRQESDRGFAGGGAGDSRLDDSTEPRQQQAKCKEIPPLRDEARSSESERRCGGGFWSDYELIGPDPNGHYRRVKPGVRLLADGVPARVGKLRALGNAIVPQLAAEVVRAWMETEGR